MVRIQRPFRIGLFLIIHSLVLCGLNTAESTKHDLTSNFNEILVNYLNNLINIFFACKRRKTRFFFSCDCVNQNYTSLIYARTMKNYKKTKFSSKLWNYDSNKANQQFINSFVSVCIFTKISTRH